MLVIILKMYRLLPFSVRTLKSRRNEERWRRKKKQKEQRKKKEGTMGDTGTFGPIIHFLSSLYCQMLTCKFRNSCLHLTICGQVQLLSFKNCISNITQENKLERLYVITIYIISLCATCIQ